MPIQGKLVPVDPKTLLPLKNLLDDIYLTRKLLRKPNTMCFGIFMSRDGKRGLTDETMQFCRVLEAVIQFMDEVFPNHPWNHIYLHCNVTTKPHKDPLTSGSVMCLGFGDYEGGELVIVDEKGVEHSWDTRYTAGFYEGSKYVHYNKPLTKGIKYSLCPVDVSYVGKLWDYKVFKNGILIHDMPDGIPKQIVIPEYLDPWHEKFNPDLYFSKSILGPRKPCTGPFSESLDEEKKEDPTEVRSSPRD